MTNVALPAIARDLGLGIAGLQWVMNGYLLTLSALMLLGGAIGDRYSRQRVFAVGLVAFAIASLGCALSPGIVVLVVARVVQGIAGALVVPNSLALLETTFEGEARGAAIGQWAAWSGVSTALGPLVGGWLVDATSWRFVFVVVAPIALIAAAIVSRAATGPRRDGARTRSPIDYRGAALATLGLAGVVGGLTEGPDVGFTKPIVLAALIAGAALLVAFVVVEGRTANALLPLDVFRSRLFVGVNATTLLVYAALSGLIFLLMLELQSALGYSALAAGASLLPVNLLLLGMSPLAGRVAHRIGPRIPMAGGALIVAAGTLLFVRVRPGASYATTVLPAAIVFGVGLAWFVAPLTSVALGALGEERAGLASGVNNAVARLAGLLATAVIPLAAGLGGTHDLRGATLSAGFARAMMISSALCVCGAVVAALTVGRSARTARSSPRE
ncbi:MAG: major facilitator superfamily 1 [Gemmatimonadetes bacterium]|nr:major facilitator superfamily 1 [Gemmatimonadota bacterium]